VPGYKVFRWERVWHLEGQPFLDPVDYPALSVATSGTHDTEPMAVWWAAAPKDEREAVLAIASLQARLGSADRRLALDAPNLPAAVRDTLIEMLYAAGSDLLILPIQDVFGWRDRINQPATVNTSNWRWRLPWLVDRLTKEPEAVETAARLSEWGKRYGR